MWRATLRTMLSRLLIAAVFVASAAVVFWLALVHTVHLGTVAVPDLTGMASEDADKAAHDLGLSVALDERGVFSQAVEPGRIADQDPLPGFHVKTGSQVVVRLSLGSERMVVPQLSGISLQSAQRELEQLGLRADAEARVAAQASGEFVLATAPPSGASVAPGTAVQLLVNTTPDRELWVMPSLISSSVASVRRFCRSNHLRLGHVHEVAYPGLSAGIVLRQYPQAGSPLSRSDIITVWASQ